MLPGSGDVLLNSRSRDDIALLAMQEIFVLQLVVADTDPRRRMTTSSSAIKRILLMADPPFSPELFAGAWIRFDATVDAATFQNYLKLLIPGGLMVVIGPSAAELDLLVAATAATSGGPQTTALHTAPLKSPTRSAALLLVRTANEGQVPPVDCRFCYPSRFAVNRQNSLPGAAAALWGDSQFLVIPDVAPVEAGHLLLTTTQHYLSMGALPADLAMLLEGHASKIDRAMQLAFGERGLFIEHGATRPHEAGSCIDHAHWHCLPDHGTIIHDLANIGMEPVSGSLSKTRTFFKRHEPYFLVRTAGQYWYFPASNLPCQFLRLVVSSAAVHSNPRWQHVLASRENHQRYGETLKQILPAADAVLRDDTKRRDSVLPEEAQSGS